MNSDAESHLVVSARVRLDSALLDGKCPGLIGKCPCCKGRLAESARTAMLKAGLGGLADAARGRQPTRAAFQAAQERAVPPGRPGWAMRGALIESSRHFQRAGGRPRQVGVVV